MTSAEALKVIAAVTAEPIPATYLPYVAAELLVLTAAIRKDVERRNDEDPYIRRLAPIPDRFVDTEAAGNVVMGVVSCGLSSTAKITELLKSIHPPVPKSA
jgi:hypothetical protein